MKTCAVMTAIWMKPNVLQMVKRVAARFEELNNMEVRIIGDVELHKRFLSSIFYSRYHAWEFVPKDVERIIYLDSDIIPLKPLPELPEVDIAAAPEREEIYKRCGEHWPVIKRAGLYFNAGVLVASRKTEKLFTRMLLRQTYATGAESPWFGDQSLMNVEVFSAVEAGELTFQALPRSYNNLILLDPDSVDDPYMIHLAGGHNLKMRAVNHMVEQLMSLERMSEIKNRYNSGQSTPRS